MRSIAGKTRASRALRVLVGTVVAFALAAGGLVATSIVESESSEAANGALFNPGMIISDEDFYNSTSMSTAQIQAFLNSKFTSCRSGYTCLKDYTESTTTRAATNHCNTYTGVANQTAANIIYSVAIACGVNPQVLLVMLQKEQGLITDTWPTTSQYNIAMGFGCPDTAPCNTEYYGFYNQVYRAARQFKSYRAYPEDWTYRAGQVNTILWNPNTACGTSSVYIENQATAGLYNYTPYRPNDAALGNMYGTGDSCSSYGNRNFWAYFTDWFGAHAGPPPSPTANATIGEPDVYLLGRDQTGAQWIYPGDGAGNVLARGQVGTGWNSMSPIYSAGDVDGDGNPDVMARDADGNLWLYPRDGAGGWLSRVQVGSGWFIYDMLINPGDSTGDGRPDILARDPQGTLWLYPSATPTGWNSRVQVGSGWGMFNTVVGAGDVDGDGKDDLIGRDTAGRLWLYTGNGSGGWKSARQVGSGWNIYANVMSGADFDGDGYPDILGRDASGNVLLYPGNGSAGWLPAKQIATGMQGLTSMTIVGEAAAVPPGPVPTPTPTPTPPPPVSGTPGTFGDFTGDGIRDLLARDGAGLLSRHTGTGGGALAAPLTVGSGWQTFSTILAADDFDGDGNQDVIARGTDGLLWLYPSDGAGGWLIQSRIGAGWNIFNAVFSVGDFDGDGNDDLMAREQSGALWFYPGNGQGGWGRYRIIGSGWNIFSSVIGPGDFDGDGLADIMARDTAGDLWLYPGNGKGGAVSRVKVDSGWQGFVSIATGGDIDGDGHVDVLARESTGVVWLYPGDGHGGFKPRVQLGADWSAYDTIL